MMGTIASIVFRLLVFTLDKVALSQTQKQALIDFAEKMAPTLGSAAKTFEAYQKMGQGLDVQKKELNKGGGA